MTILFWVASVLLVIGALAGGAPAWAESARGEVLEIKQSSTGGPNPDRDATLLLRLDGFSSTDSQCSSGGVSTMRVNSDRAMFQQMMSIAMAAFLSGRRVRVWFTLATGGCNVYAVSILN